MTETLGYHLIIKEGKVEKEDGFFFKAAPFTIQDNDLLFKCAFKKGSHGHVVYALTLDNALICELDHPIYAPDCPPKDISSFIKTPNNINLDFVFSGLVRQGITTDKEYKAHHISNEAPPLSYEIFQTPFLS
ncbi:MAG: hypothetical protein HRT90_00890 [Candidatus Margulisbacteria bacterium]|nr:hypothetical protein [Candidatus Margulisiibacteriota bacterium]